MPSMTRGVDSAHSYVSHRRPEDPWSRALSFADQHDIDEFIATLEKFERGAIGPDQWRAFRLVRGTYGQRQDGDVHMLRVKVPQGVLDARQLYAFATVAETYSRGFGHITTRQNIQFHFGGAAGLHGSGRGDGVPP